MIYYFVYNQPKPSVIARAMWIAGIVMLLSMQHVTAQTVILRGTVRDQSGERLPSAYIVVYPDSIRFATNSNGNFSQQLSSGKKTIQVSFVGYELLWQSISLQRDTSFTFTLRQSIGQLHEVEIIGQRNLQESVLQSNRSSTYLLSQKDIRMLPVLGGEADVIKTLQLLPGTLRGVEGSSDLFVRGGAADQNLVLLDDVPIYNPSHMLGFLSVFNPDILSKVEAINGGFPAEFGGRLSSILNIETTDRLADTTHVSGDIGIIASRLYVEQPIVKNKASFWVAARRTYIDQVVKALGEKLPYYFYDLNGKFIVTPTDRDRMEVSYYGGNDRLELFRDRNNDGDGFLTEYVAGNNSISLQWNHRMASRWSSNLSLLQSRYKYNIRNAFEENELQAYSDIQDYGARWLIQRDSVAGTGTVKGGLEWTRHAVSPNIINTQGTIAELFESSATTGRISNEFAIHAQYEWSATPRWRFNTGLRASMAFVTGKQYFIPEPRLSARYAINNDQALKFSYSRMAQYMHRISSSAVTSPTDIWYPVTQSIRPQTSHQVAIAWQRSYPKQNIFLSTEVYYKSMNDLIGYEEGTNLFLNNDFASKLIQGKGKAYGLEVLLRKDAGKFTGWISYTLSWSWRQFDEINHGAWFYSRYDRRHNGAVVMQYAISKRWAASMVWEYISGSRFTPVIGQYVMLAPTLTGVDLVPIYSGINEVKLANTHRLDIGIKYKSKPERKFQWQWFAGVYNVYNRANPIGIIIEQDETTNALRYEQPGLFGLIPFISYGFRF
ncbi:MAG TPA: TonB-dependent receptor [Ohtaekwangia sp.]|uniref:TonB-dependent receptor n=1 Tax=Ohtaekwangia sp. TaxID=2066019 RepID=UPI002F92EDAA